jgi:hypothetical protein
MFNRTLYQLDDVRKHKKEKDARETRERTRKRTRKFARDSENDVSFIRLEGSCLRSSGVATTEVHQSTFFLFPFRLFRGHPSPLLLAFAGNFPFCNS